VGPVQSLLASHRMGVYREGGVPDGDVVAERHAVVGQTRDAQWQDSPAGPVASVPEPWYSAPATVTGSAPSASVSYRDQPSFDLPGTVGSGRLTETRGEDQFVTSLAALRGSRIVHLRSSSWRVPWNLSVDASGTGTGAGVAGSGSRFGPPTTTGPIAVASAEDWLAFPSVAAAVTAPANLLMQNLVPARRNDRAAWAVIADALVQTNPTFRVVLSVVEAAAWLGNDSFEVVASGHRSVRLGPFSLGDGDSTALSLSLTDLFDPRRIGAGDALHFQLVGAGIPVPTMSWTYPFNQQARPARLTRGNGGHYTMTGRLR
jgi:hypothetical protein